MCIYFSTQFNSSKFLVAVRRHEWRILIIWSSSKGTYKFSVQLGLVRDHRETLRLGGGTISDSILGGHKTLFLLNLYNFKNIGGGGTCPPCPPTPQSLPVAEWMLISKKQN